MFSCFFNSFADPTEAVGKYTEYGEQLYTKHGRYYTGDMSFGGDSFYVEYGGEVRTTKPKPPTLYKKESNTLNEDIELLKNLDGLPEEEKVILRDYILSKYRGDNK